VDAFHGGCCRWRSSAFAAAGGATVAPLTPALLTKMTQRCPVDAAKLIARVGELVASQKLDSLNDVMAEQLRARAALTGASAVSAGLPLELSTVDETEPQPWSEVIPARHFICLSATPSVPTGTQPLSHAQANHITPVARSCSPIRALSPSSSGLLSLHLCLQVAGGAGCGGG
jgi:hypothetical protein